MNDTELNKIAQEMFGVNYDELGTFGKWEVEDKLKTKEEEVEEEINKVLDEESQKHYKSFMNEIEDKFMGIKPKEDEDTKN